MTTNAKKEIVAWDNIPETLTPEQVAFRDRVYDEWYAKLTATRDVNEDVVRAEMAWLYGYDNMPAPDVRVLESPAAVVKDARKIDANISATQWIGLSWDAPRVALYDAYNRMKAPDGKPMLFNEIMEHIRAISNAGFWDGVLFDNTEKGEPGLVLCSRRPLEIHHDEKFNPHSTTGPCARWSDGFAIYAYHGIELPGRYIETPAAITRDDILGERNTEVVRAIAEILGWETFLERVGTKLVDTCELPFFDVYGNGKTLKYELHELSRPGDRWERAPKFLRMQSPELVDGQQPFYIEPVHPGLKTAAAARRWQFPTKIYPETVWPSVEEANKNPELSFAAES
jgi:hypothetical protein